MRIPQMIMGCALVVLVILLFTDGPVQRAPAYNAANEVTVQGVVQDVQEFYCPISGNEGTHLTVKTETGTFQVHVAPKWVLRSDNLSFSKGDQIQVVGSRIFYMGHDAVIARTIVRGNQTVAFRWPSGKPAWGE
jgi:DNA/RNA endonuclease YhcR with UshA esterase domain